MTHELIDIAGHAAYLALICGQFAVARKRRWGWVVRVVGSLVWAVLGWFLGLSSVVLWSLAFAAIDTYGWWRRRNEQAR